MDAQRWSAIDELFQAALAVGRSERARVLSERSGNDVELRAEVESLLTAHERASSILDSPAFDVPAGANGKRAPSIAPGKRIGKYTLRSVIGHGGSGTVYEAEQDEPSRVVALKALRAAPGIDEWTPRLFRREAQALARLQHPGIAAVYEAGLGDEGSYYFAMERVEGIPLTEFVRGEGLSIRRRLEIFQAVCDAVHYAHQHGVIHRDLKPSNILVTPSGRPKVLDFGLARITDLEGQHTRTTEIGVFLGTLAYASPEQVSSRTPGDVDLRSDVYSLGVVLFEVLTGARPYEIQGLTLPEAARVICEESPRSLASAAPALRGDLVTIVHKAIEKDAERRYTSVAALGDDVARYLAREPILAHPPSTTYQLRKLVERHRLPFAIAGAAFTLLLGLSVWLEVLYIRARDSERLAEHRAATSDRVREFILDMFARHTELLEGEQLRVSELLRWGVQRIDVDLRGEPQIQAQLLHSIVQVHRPRGEFAQAATLLQRELELRIRELGEDEGMVAHIRQDLGGCLIHLNRFTEAQAQFEAALSALEASRGSSHESVAQALARLAEALREQDPKRAEALQRRAVGIYHALCGGGQWIVNPDNGHEYRLTDYLYWGASDTSPRTRPDWSDAEAEAVGYGGHLVTINDAAENAWLVSTFGGSVHYWIGLTDLGSERSFYWISGEPATFSSWDFSQPDNAHAGSEDTVHTNHFFGSSPGNWNDLGAKGNGPAHMNPYLAIIERIAVTAAPR